MEEQRLISVIVPIYKVEKELPRCLDSLLAQTYSKFELLLIDDGSPDRSNDIMKEYAQRDKRIKVFRKENGGVSSARNLGLEQAHGKYICFVDGDDVVAPCYLEWLCRAMQESGLPLAICRQAEFDKNEVALFCDLPTKMPALTTHQIENYTFWDENVCTRCVRGMMEAKLIRDIRFNEQIAIGEDALFMVQALLLAKKYVCVPCELYAYYIRPGSALHQDVFSPKQYSEVITWEKICTLVERQQGSMRQTAEERLVVACAHVYYRMAASSSSDKTLEDKLIHIVRKHWRAAWRIPSEQKRQKKKLWMLILCPAVGCWMWKLGKRLKKNG